LTVDCLYGKVLVGLVLLVAAVHNLGKLFTSGRARRVFLGRAIGGQPALGRAAA
jgi:hypothetical protein